MLFVVRMMRRTIAQKHIDIPVFAFGPASEGQEREGRKAGGEWTGTAFLVHFHGFGLNFGSRRTSPVGTSSATSV